MGPKCAHLDISSVLSALEALDADTDSSQSSPRSYHSNGHDGLTDMSADEADEAPDAHSEPAHAQTPAPCTSRPSARPTSCDEEAQSRCAQMPRRSAYRSPFR